MQQFKTWILFFTLIFIATAEATPPLAALVETAAANHQREAFFEQKNVPIEDLLKNILRPLPELRRNPKFIPSLLNQAAAINNQPENGKERILANSQSSSSVGDQEDVASSSSISQVDPQVISGDLPVTVMVQSSDDKNNYTVTNDEEKEALGESLADEEQIFGSTANPLIISTTPDNDASLSSSTMAVDLTTEGIRENSASTSSTPTENQRIKEALEKLFEKVVEKYQSKEEVASEEYLWYDDNGEMLFSQEDTLPKNVKRQVDDKQIVRPVPLSKTDPAVDEVLRLQQVTDVIDRFRSMLDIAQQVDYYLTKRLQMGINALAAMYNDDGTVPRANAVARRK